ncbi:MAG TPA: SurA N-terminal domain-containing protein [Vicinamibacterales bacterium]|nr:SurA N-terminal domain-containing protein [Vicinamibacterales bacterium]
MPHLRGADSTPPSPPRSVDRGRRIVRRGPSGVRCGDMRRLARCGFVGVLLLVTIGLPGAAACRSAPSPSTPAVSPDVWAVVDGREIRREEVEKAFRRARDLSRPLSDEEALTLKLSLLDELVVNEILLARARELKIEVPDTELDAAYAEAKKNISDEAFQKELAARSLTAADMREGLRRELLARRVLEREVGSKIAVTDQEVTDFFNANRAQFNLPEDAYHLAQIVVTPVRDPQVANRTGDDAATPQAAAAKVSMLMERLKAGAAFAELAMDYSEDPETAPRGGDLGFVPVSALQQAPPALRTAVLQITPGSARVVSQGGAHTIVYVVAKEPAGQRELTSPGVRERITEAIRGRKEQLLRTAYLASLRDRADVTNYVAQRIVEAQGKVPDALR